MNNDKQEYENDPPLDKHDTAQVCWCRPPGNYTLDIPLVLQWCICEVVVIARKMRKELVLLLRGHGRSSVCVMGPRVRNLPSCPFRCWGGAATRLRAGPDMILVV